MQQQHTRLFKSNMPGSVWLGLDKSKAVLNNRRIEYATLFVAYFLGAACKTF